MLNGVYSQNIIRQSVAQQMNSGQISTPQHNYPQFKEFSPEANKAICAYMSPVINRDTVPQIPLKAMINRLKMQGKIEGKDFVLDRGGNGNQVLSINNKYGLPEKEIHYDNGDFDHWSSCDEFIYKGNKRIRSLTKNDKGQTLYYSNTYYNNEVPQQSFMAEGIAEANSLSEYIEYLTKNNYKYSIKKDEYSYFVETYNDQNKKVLLTQWCNDQIVCLDKYDENENVIQGITFEPDRTIVGNFTLKSIPVGHFSRKEFPQENFTDEKITYETTPKDYVNYLKSHNKNFKIYKTNDDNQKTLMIKEFDIRGNELLSTIWDFDPHTNNGLTAIIRESNNPNGSRTRIVFDKSSTYVERFNFQ